MAQKFVKQVHEPDSPDYWISPEHLVNMGPGETEPLERVVVCWGGFARKVYWHQYPNRPHYSNAGASRVNVLIYDQLVWSSAKYA